MKSFKFFLFFLSFFLFLRGYSQDLILDGIISGYNYNPSKGIFKKGSEVLLEGRLSDVKINVLNNNSSYKTTFTDNNGKFHLELPVGESYRIEVTKSNYDIIAFNLDLSKGSNDRDINFWSLELILNSHLPKKEDKTHPIFGTIGFSENEFNFREAKQESSLFKKQVDYDPLISLILESIEKNKSNIYTNKEGASGTSNGEKGSKLSDPQLVQDHVQVVTPQLVNNLAYKKLVVFDTDFSDVNISERELIILEAKKQLEIDKLNAKTPLDHILIADREALIEAAENELVHLKEIIAQKDNAINLKNIQLVLFGVVLLLLVVMAFFVMRSNKIKSKLNTNLANTNKKISDSIDYAVKIQNAILPIQLDLKNHIDSFILFKPKDKVSGDYYWFEEVNNKVIIAAIDCTGHGVPGAFMSMIGNTLMNSIILEREITSPKQILETLHVELQAALRQDDADPFKGQDGMDLSICAIDKSDKKITYAGAMNALYLLKNNEVQTLDVTNKGIGGFDFFNGGSFLEKEIKLEVGTQLYMLSDGFMDQFGGKTSEKYNLSRFKELLLKCQSKTTQEQLDVFESAFNEWKGSQEQTDDVLVIGINL